MPISDLAAEIPGGGGNPVDSELLPALALFPPLLLDMETLPALRAALSDALMAIPAAESQPVAFSERFVPGPEGAPPVRVLEYRPIDAAGPLPVVLHIHPGGYVIGTPEMMDAANREIAAQLDCAVYSVDYRLAPETRYPGAVEDCYAVLAWLHQQAQALGLDPERIGVKGESAGGGLAAALALLVRDRGKLALAFQHLHYPMLDDRTTAGSTSPWASELVWSPEQNAFGWSALLGDARGGGDVAPYAAAARATDMAGLPRTFLSLGALDVLAEEGMDFARRLLRADVPLELHVFPGAFHGFDVASDARIGAAAKQASRDALRRTLHG
ncbi:MAG: Esterase/lipase/thioesterase [Sphingomonas bacterium]|nr:Esterase/lipase/thioesterase [Sphingomonas bacterium]